MSPSDPADPGSRPSRSSDDGDLLDRLLQALDTMQVGLTLTDENRRILYVNRAEAEMHGYRQEELVGRTASLLAPPEDRRPRGSLDLTRISGWKRERENLRKDGTRFPVELLSDVITDAQGRPVGMVTISQDITERRERERALGELHERYALAIEGAHDGIWDWDLVAGEIVVSRRWLEMVGLGQGERPATMDDWIERVHPEDRRGFRTSLEAHLEGGSDHFEIEHRLLHADGSYRWMLARGVAVRRALPDAGSGGGDPPATDGADVRAVRMAGSLTDVTERRVRDPLTDLPNRLLLLDRLEHALERRERSVPGEVAVLFLDLDGFKLVNDSLGHLFGDQVLAAVAHRLRELVRSEETLARLGGDEFVVVLEQVRDGGEATAVAARLHDALGAPVSVGEQQIFISASIGIALTADGDPGSAPGPSVAVRARDLLREADTAMYKAKAAGRGQTRVFDESMRSHAMEELELGNHLRRALERDQLEVHYQPIYSTSSRRIVGAEALLRWRHPTRGLMTPDRFLHLAEETGAIVPIGAWVVRTACSQARAWIEALPEGMAFTIAVNFSPQELAHRDFVPQVRSALRESGLDPGRLRLEVTEATLIQDRPTVAAKLNELRADGVEVTVDDFGIGYSSLSYLDHLPVDVLKIDRSFVAGIDRQPSRRNMVQSILQMAAQLDIEVVAEGAETEEQIGALLDLQCLFFQGHAMAFAEPAPALSALLGLGPGNGGQQPGQSP